MGPPFEFQILERADDAWSPAKYISASTNTYFLRIVRDSFACSALMIWRSNFFCEEDWIKCKLTNRRSTKAKSPIIQPKSSDIATKSAHNFTVSSRRKIQAEWYLRRDERGTAMDCYNLSTFTNMETLHSSSLSDNLLAEKTRIFCRDRPSSSVPETLWISSMETSFSVTECCGKLS
ncbi:hypothetical protein M5K25_007739 [Dendrobium thyrsiflorum]|uniref:Uncharacterized protein n=1 Tax=Dendrobium thyrsiflorum TaxID=117978 RepID=A0ABD0VFH9_DENTH